ncbi:MAG: hypothetical protein JXB23_16700, partial [Candidatus Aminicenantes bacterium]|nr:hypothetical protein [Candidatus Aminicenantes bacterium]
MYAWIYRNLRTVYPGGLETKRHFLELDKTQWFSTKELKEWQLSRIQKLVKYAYDNVPFYQNLYKKMDIHPSDIRSFKDFQALPFLTREAATENLESLVSSEKRNEVQLTKTGGSTGEPFRFYVDRSYHWWDAALEFRSRSWYGVREGEKIAWVWGAARDMYDHNLKARMKARFFFFKQKTAYEMN